MGRKTNDRIENGDYLGKYFTQFPNLIDDSDLTPHEFRVLLHYYRVGREGCWEGVRTTAKKCKMSVGKVSDVRQALAAKGFISIYKKDDGSVLIRAVNKAAENIAKYDGEDDSSLHEHHRDEVHGANEAFMDTVACSSGDERKNNPVKNTTLRTTPLPPEGNGEVGSGNVFEKEKTNTDSGAAREAELDLLARQAAFKKEVYDIGRLKYTEEMLKRFYRTYSQPDRGKRPKMRWEKETGKKGWNTADRLELWASRNLDRIQCYLTEGQKTIVQKRREFAVAIEAFKDRYPREVLLGFYRKYSLPENVPDPKRLAWECEDYWDLGTNLAKYNDNYRTKPNPTHYGKIHT